MLRSPSGAMEVFPHPQLFMHICMHTHANMLKCPWGHNHVVHAHTTLHTLKDIGWGSWTKDVSLSQAGVTSNID